MWPRHDGMRAFSLGTAGEMRDRLTALTLDGTKVATAGLWRYEYEDGAEAIEHVGERQVLLDSAERPVAIVEITRVETHAFRDVPWEFAQAEGEGFTSIEHWRDGHRSFYAAQGQPVADDDLVVCVWMRVVERLGGEGTIRSAGTGSAALPSPRAVVERFLREARDPETGRWRNDVIAECFDIEGYVSHTWGAGLAETGRRMGGFFGAFGSRELIDSALVADGDLVVYRSSWRAPVLGTVLGLEGDGRTVEVHHVEMWRVEHGKIVEHWGGIGEAQHLWTQLRETAPEPDTT